MTDELTEQVARAICPGSYVHLPKIWLERAERAIEVVRSYRDPDPEGPIQEMDIRTQNRSTRCASQYCEDKIPAGEKFLVIDGEKYHIECGIATKNPDSGKRCLAIACRERNPQALNPGKWWTDYGTCSRAHAVEYYGGDVVE